MLKIEVPTNCPTCDYILELVNDQLFCRNSSCEAQVGKKIEHFCKTLKIKGLGPATVSKLQLEDVTQLFFLDEVDLTEAVGSKLAVKLLQEIEGAKKADFATALAAFSIPLVGNTISGKLASVVNSFEDITIEICKQAGLGDKATTNILNWLETEYQDLKEFLPFKFEGKINQPVGGKTICITGKLSSFSTKKEAALALNAKGYQVVDNLTKTVDFLVDESNKSSSKRLKAEASGISIITDLKQFLLVN